MKEIVVKPNASHRLNIQIIFWAVSCRKMVKKMNEKGGENVLI